MASETSGSAWTRRPFVLVALLLCITDAHAQAAPSLVEAVTTLTNNGVFQYNGLEFAAAAANDSAYSNLLKICAPSETGAPVSSSCSGPTQALFGRLRELEDNADQLLGRGETQYSLRLDPEGLGSALRWTAPEEYAAQGSMATRFANNQAAVLNNRFAALRIATMQRFARGDARDDGDGMLAAADDFGAFGGGAGGNAGGFSLGRLSVFINGGFGTGEKSATTYEDAFSFDGTEASAGADYRLTKNLVVGLLVGHSERRVDFNSEESVVDGRIRGNGQGGTLYAQFETDAFYVNASIGVQHLSLHTARRITYPSNNPDIPSVDETSLSDTGANTLTTSVSGGYVFNYRGFSAEPYLNGEYVHVRINSFTEHSGAGFDFDVDEQNIHSTTGSVGLKLQYAVLPRFGVIVPYVYGEYRHIFSDPSRVVQSSYAAGDSSQPDMNLPTAAAPGHYYVVGGGGSVVLKHGLQGFMQYMKILNYTDYTDHVVSGGVRWEF